MKRTDYITPCTDLLDMVHRAAVLFGSIPIEVDYGESEEEGVADTRSQNLWAEDFDTDN